MSDEIQKGVPFDVNILVANLKKIGESHTKIYGDIPTPEKRYLCRPTCMICQGSGMYREDITDIHHPKFGKIFTCPRRGNWS